jgi:hypothetical protein
MILYAEFTAKPGSEPRVSADLSDHVRSALNG